MTVIDFTHASCKNNIDTMNKQIVENFEEHFAMYSLNNIKNIKNIEISKNDNCYIVKCKKEECDDIIDKLSSYKCSNFQNTLTPIFTVIEGGLKIEFKIDGE